MIMESEINSNNISNQTNINNINSLILSCSKSKESLCTLYNMFKKSVFAVAFSITSDYQLAEDCVAETFIRLAQIQKFNPDKGDGKGFIHKIARNVALEIRRSHRKDIDNVFIKNYNISDDNLETSIFINELLSVLNDKQRQIVVMKICSELSFKEIAHIMKSPESTVKSRYKKAICILQEKAGVGNDR